MIKAEPQHCALCAGPCCVLRVTAVKPNWKEKMLEPVLRIPTPAGPAWAYSSGEEPDTAPYPAGLHGVCRHEMNRSANVAAGVGCEGSGLLITGLPKNQSKDKVA